MDSGIGSLSTDLFQATGYRSFKELLRLYHIRGHVDTVGVAQLALAAVHARAISMNAIALYCALL
jgi:hypothetical protein